MDCAAAIVDLSHTGSVLANDEVAPGCFRMEIRCPELARRARPGQFVMLRCRQGFEPLLARAFSICDLIFEGGDAPPGEEGEPIGIVVLQVVIGKGTLALSQRQVGEPIGVMGPLGNPYDLGTVEEHMVLLAGGVGAAPFALVARALRRRSPVQRVTYIIGARSKEYLFLAGEIGAMGCDIGLATDDGSAGHHGFVTDLLPPLLEPGVRVLACGPNPMFKQLAKVVARSREDGFTFPCQVSTEEPMPCGFGACCGCVVPVHSSETAEGYRYVKSCVNGPVFDVEEIRWDLIRSIH